MLRSLTLMALLSIAFAPMAAAAQEDARRQEDPGRKPEDAFRHLNQILHRLEAIQDNWEAFVKGLEGDVSRERLATLKEKIAHLIRRLHQILGDHRDKREDRKGDRREEAHGDRRDGMTLERLEAFLRELAELIGFRHDRREDKREEDERGEDFRKRLGDMDDEKRADLCRRLHRLRADGDGGRGGPKPGGRGGDGRGGDGGGRGR